MATVDLSTRSDADLVAASQEGSKDAFAALVGRHRPMALVLVRRLLRDDDLAADAMQEATVAALVGLERLHSPERFGAWYAGIALNMARRWLRGPSLEPLSAEVVDGGPRPEEQVEAAEVAARVRGAVAALAPGQRAAVLAFYWLGLTHAEAALELGTTPGAVKARLHQARAALAPQLSTALEIREEVRAMASTDESTWVEVEIIEVRRSEGGDPLRRPHVVVLQERGGTRRFPIYTGGSEAIALACGLELAEMPRPMTYQLAANLLAATQSHVTDVRITELAESTFYAVVVVQTPAGAAEVDARPSDALNLAVVSGAPIRVAAGLLDNPAATRRTAWQQFPTRAPELVAEVREYQAEFLASLTQERQDELDPEEP